MAVAVHPEFEYDLIRAGDDFYILAKELAAGCAQRFGWTGWSVAGKWSVGGRGVIVALLLNLRLVGVSQDSNACGLNTIPLNFGYL